MEMLTDLDCGVHGKWVLPQNGATNINHNEILTLLMLGRRRTKPKTQILTANHTGKTIAERSLMVTEIFIKSPVPGKDGQTWGEDEQREGLRQRGGDGVVMPPGSCINRHAR